MRDLCTEFNTYMHSGSGTRTEAQVAILEAYKACLGEVEGMDIFPVMNSLEDIYNTLEVTKS